MYYGKPLSIFPLYILFIIGISRSVQYYGFQHTLYPGESVMYRDCFLMPKAYGNYKNRYAQDVNNYIYYCIRNQKRPDNLKIKKCSPSGTKRTFETLYNHGMYTYKLRPTRKACILANTRCSVLFDSISFKLGRVCITVNKAFVCPSVGDIFF